nr:hypothetical protein [Tanacetum cinerariifolium]
MWLLSLHKAPAALMNLMLLIVFLLLQAIVLRHKLDKEDLEQIYQDDLEEIDLKWQVAMLSIRMKRFYNKTRRKLEFNGKEPFGFDKNKVEYFNCHRRGHFARDCRSARNLGNMSRDDGNARYRGRDNGKRPAKEEDEQALVVQEGLGTYDWSYQVEEEATDFALMAFVLNPLSSSSSNSELDEALKEKEDLKAKLEKFETSSKNLTKLLDSQTSAKVKIGLGYDSQFNKKEVLDKKEEEVTKTVFDNRSSDEENSVANDSLAKDENDAPKTSTALVEKPKEDRSSASFIEDCDTDNDDDSVFTPESIPTKIDFVKAGESIKNVKPVESVKHVKLVTPVKTAEQTEKSKNFSSSPKVDKKNWNGKITQKLGLGFGFCKKACFVCGSLSHLIKDCTFYKDRMAKKTMLPTNVGKGTVFTRSGRIPDSVAKPKAAASTSVAKPVNTVGHKQSVNFSRTTSTFHKSHSPIRRSFYKATAHSRRNLTKRVNTTGSKAVSVVKGNRVTAIKTSASYVWGPRVNSIDQLSKDNRWTCTRVDYGHPQQALKNKGIVDSGCSRHMTRSKAYLANYQEIHDGGFVAFGSSRGKITGKGTIRIEKLDFDDVYFVNELKFNLFFVSQMFDKKNSVLFTETECLVLSPNFKLLDECQVLLRVPRQTNMYSFDLQNVVPSGDLTCLFIKASIDESKSIAHEAWSWNQIDKNAGSQDTNGNAGTQDNPKDDTGSNTFEESVNKDDQGYKDELDKLISQEKEANNASDALRKEFEQGCMDQRGVTKAGSTNSFNTVSNPVNAASTSGTFSAGGPSSPHPDAFIPANTLIHIDQDDIPDLEDTAELQSTGIFNSAYDDDLDKFDSLVQSVGEEADFNNMESSTIFNPIPTHKVHIDHPKDQILGDPKSAVQTRGMVNKNSRAHALVSYIHKQRRTNHKDYKNCLFACFLSQMEPKKVSQAFDDESWVEAMNKKDEKGIVVRNKARLVAQGHRQEEGIDYDEVFTPVARIEAIEIFLAFVSFIGFVVYQMDFKSAFLYGIIEEEVGTNDKTLFIKKDKDDIMLVQVYVDEIIFGSTKKSLCDEFEALMHKRFQMSSIGELTFFLGLQVKLREEGIFISQDKPDIMFAVYACSRFQVTRKLSHLQAVKRIFSTIMMLLSLVSEAFIDLAMILMIRIGFLMTEENAEFYQIVDFLSTCSINYALTDVVISESSVRSDLLFNDEDDLPEPFNDTYETPKHSKKVTDPGAKKLHWRGADAQTRFETASKRSSDPPLNRLQKKVKILEKKQRERTLGKKLFKIGTSKKKTLDKENVSKQRKDGSNITEELNLSDKGSGETEVFDYTTAAKKDINVVEPVSTAGDAVNAASVISNVSDAGPSTSTADDIFEDKMTTMVDTLMAIRSTRPRTTSVVIHDVEKEPRRETPPPTVQSQDKEIAQRLFEEEQSQFKREQRIAREKATKQEAKDVALIKQIEDVHARIDADALLAERLQQEEREQSTVDEQAKMLVDLIAKRKSISFEEIQMLYERKQKWINDFVLMDFKEVNDSKQQAEGSKKRSRVDHDKESVKKQKLEENDAKKEELRACLDIVLVDNIAIDVESLATKYPIKDIVDLYRLVKERYETTSPEGYDLLLWGDLITLFEPNKEDVIWKAQHDYNLISWRLFDSCGVHVLLMDIGIAIHMLVERKYPLIQEMMSRMLNRKIKIDHESEMAFELIRFIKI